MPYSKCGDKRGKRKSSNCYAGPFVHLDTRPEPLPLMVKRAIELPTRNSFIFSDSGEMSTAQSVSHLKRILRLGRLRLRGPNGARDEFLLAATAQNLRKLAKLAPTVSFDPTLA